MGNSSFIEPMCPLCYVNLLKPAHTNFAIITNNVFVERVKKEKRCTTVNHVKVTPIKIHLHPRQHQCRSF